MCHSKNQKGPPRMERDQYQISAGRPIAASRLHPPSRYLLIVGGAALANGRVVMNQSGVVMLATVVFVGAAAAAQAGPCATRISEAEQQIQTQAAASPPGGAGEPSAPQSVDAQLHHQPTPGSVQSAEHAANADGEAAIELARKADAEGNASACAEALAKA